MLPGFPSIAMEEASFFLLLTCLCPPAQMTSNINQGLCKEKSIFPPYPTLGRFSYKSTF